MKPAASWIASPGYLGSRYPAALSAYPNASAQNMVQNRCARAHLGSVPTSPMISKKSGCRRWSMAVSAVYSRALSDRTAFDRDLSSETANFMGYDSPRVFSHQRINPLDGLTDRLDTLTYSPLVSRKRSLSLFSGQVLRFGWNIALSQDFPKCPMSRGDPLFSPVGRTFAQIAAPAL